MKDLFEQYTLALGVTAVSAPLLGAPSALIYGIMRQCCPVLWAVPWYFWFAAVPAVLWCIFAARTLYILGIRLSKCCVDE